MKFQTPLALGFAFAVLGSFTPGCTGRKAPPADTLRVHVPSEPVSLDPALAEDGIALRILANTMNGLVGFDGAGHLENRLAESYAISPDGLTYEFTIRPRAQWSDGQPVRASQFVAGLRRSMDPATGSKLAAMLTPLRGVFERDGKLVLQVSGQTPYLMQVLALSVGLPVREDVLKANGGHWPTDAPVTGPYRIVQHVQDQKYVLERNPRYWNAAATPHAPVKVELVIVADESTGLNLFNRGQIDILGRVPALDLPRLREAGLVQTDPFLATYYLAFNTRSGLFRDRLWRRAVSGAIRRGQILEALRTGETAARSWIPRGLEGYLGEDDARAVFSDAIAMAKKQGIPAGTKVVAGFDSGSRNATVLEKVQQDLAEELGIRIELSNLDWKSYVQTLAHEPPSIYRFGWLAPFPDPLSHLQVFTSGNANNYTGWSNEKYDRLVEEIAGMKPGPAREAKIREAQRVLVDDEAAVVPIFHYVQNHAVSKRVQGFRVNPLGAIPFAELKIAAGEESR